MGWSETSEQLQRVPSGASSLRNQQTPLGEVCHCLRSIFERLFLVAHVGDFHCQCWQRACRKSRGPLLDEGDRGEIREDALQVISRRADCRRSLISPLINYIGGIVVRG